MTEDITIKGKKVGEINGMFYYTDRMPEKHFYHKGLSYPISTYILKVLKQKKVEIIRIREHMKLGEVRLWQIPVSEYDNIQPFQEKDNDEQKSIPLTKFKRIQAQLNQGNLL